MSEQLIGERTLIQSLLRQHYDDPSLEIELVVCQGGDIHQSYIVKTNGLTQIPGQLFAKTNTLSCQSVLESEYSSLSIFKKLAVPFYPKPITYGADDKHCCLIMSYHKLGHLDGSAAASLGEILVQQHRFSATTFGWEMDNHIGFTPQHNAQTSDWVDFYREQRLLPQINLAARNTLAKELITELERILDSLEMFFQNYELTPSLLHGDLWSGNVALEVTSEQPLLYDPAPYYGDRETDIAMTELFGKFPLEFYKSYQHHWPLHEDYQIRKPLYKLYHALNHFNLFGDVYSGMIRIFCNEVLSFEKIINR